MKHWGNYKASGRGTHCNYIPVANGITIHGSQSGSIIYTHILYYAVATRDRLLANDAMFGRELVHVNVYIQ